MASANKHEALGISLWIFFLVFIVLSFSFNYERLALIAVVGFCFTFLGSIVPDIDNRSSRMFKHTRLFLGLTTFLIAFVLLSPRMHAELFNVLYILGICALVTIGVVIMLHVLMPSHRKSVHSVKSGTVYGVASFVGAYVVVMHLYIAAVIALFAFLAFSSHLVLDKR
jgi:hypothetical protein